jgi:hypothetical protein
LLVLIVLGSSTWLFWQKREKSTRFTPTLNQTDIDFLLDNHLKGNMFNEFSKGGDLIYHLYPSYKVFFDSRADVYFCCEIRSYWPIITTKFSSEAEFQKAVDEFLDKYDFSYMIIINSSFNPLELTGASLMADYLLDRPDWNLVYFSDQIQVLVKDDGKNEIILKQFGMETLAPLRLNPYRQNQGQKAKEEYIKILEISDSGLARSGLGQVLLDLNEEDAAEEQFERAILLNPNLGKGYLGLAKVSLKKDKINLAVELLNKSLKKSPYLGESYLLLAQTYFELNRNELALQTIERGLNEKIDFLSRQKLVQLQTKIR